MANPHDEYRQCLPTVDLPLNTESVAAFHLPRESDVGARNDVTPELTAF